MENSDQFFALTQHEQKCGVILHPCLSFYEPRPATGFAQLFEANFQFVDEVIAGFRCFGFAVVWVGRRAGTQDLSSDMIAGTRGGQTFGQINHCGSEFEQPVFKIKFPALVWALMKLRDFARGIFGR